MTLKYTCNGETLETTNQTAGRPIAIANGILALHNYSSKSFLIFQYYILYYQSTPVQKPPGYSVSHLDSDSLKVSLLVVPTWNN